MKNKNFIAIGKIMFETPGYSWNIPHTHFIVNKTPGGLYEATNLEFILDSVGDTVENAARTLAGLTAHYVLEIMLSRRGHDELVETIDTNVMEDCWREYRKIEFELSRTKNNLSHNMDRLMVDAIKETMDESLKKIIYEKAKQEAEEVYKALRGMMPDSVSLKMEYKQLEVA